MANRNYAENLIGNWETNQYEPQRQVVRDVYRTNWNKLTSDLNTLKDQLNRNFERAKTNYGDTLGQTTNDSFSRMYNVENNLANRGLTGSGLINRYNQSDIAKKGDETNTALSKLLNTNEQGISGLISGVSNYGGKLNSLAGDLADDLGGISDKERANAQQYANLVSSIIESAEDRDLAKYKASMSRKQEETDEETNLILRRLGIMKTLEDDTLSDNEKLLSLVNDYDMKADDAVSAMNSVRYTNTKNKLDDAKQRLNKLTMNSLEYVNPNNRLNNIPGVSSVRKGASYVYDLFRDAQQNRVNSLNDELSNYTYKDLAELINNYKYR